MRSLEEFEVEKELRALRSDFEAFKVQAVNDIASCEVKLEMLITKLNELVDEYNSLKHERGLI